MKKITVESSQPVRKLVAVVGTGNEGFFHIRGGRVMYTTASGTAKAQSGDGDTLESLLKNHGGESRTPVYEGDYLRITF